MGIRPPLSDRTTLWIPTAAFLTTSGTPSHAATNSSVPNWLFDAASIESIATSVQVPWGWATTHVDLYWRNAIESVGDVVWRLDWASAGDGEALLGVTDLPTAETQVTAAAPAAARATTEVTRVGTGVAFTPGELTLVKIQRRATDAADTLTNDANALGMLLTKAS